MELKVGMPYNAIGLNTYGPNGQPNRTKDTGTSLPKGEPYLLSANKQTGLGSATGAEQ